MKKIIIFGILAGFLAALLITQPSIFTNLSKSLKSFKISISPKEKTEPSPLPTEPPQKPDISLLKDVSIENLEVNGQKYTLNQGEVKFSDQSATESASISEAAKDAVAQLAFFYQWSKEDPLFTAPYFGLDDFKKTIDLLNYLETEYNKLTSREEHFFPLSFLEKITAVFEAESNFFSTPSDKNAQNLITVYQGTATAYQKEADRFWQTIQENSAKIPDTNYVSVNNTTTKDVTFADVKKITQNGPALLEEIEKRKKCLEKGQNCQIPSTGFTEPNDDGLLKENYEKPLPPSALFPLIKQSDLNTRLKGPYLVSTPCFGWGKNFEAKIHPFFLLIRFGKGPKDSPFEKPIEDFFSFKLASNNFYRKVPEEGAEGALMNLKVDLPYIYQAEDNTYVCRNATYQVKLLTLDYFWQNFRGKKLLDKIEPEMVPEGKVNLIRQGQTFEENFFSTAPPSWSNLEILSSYYAFFYKTLPSTIENMKLKDELLRRYLLVNRHLGNFSSLANKSIWQFGTILIKEKIQPKSTTQDLFLYAHVYLSRNFWNLLYFPFSSSFWRASENLDYIKRVKIETVSEDGLFLDHQAATEKFDSQMIIKMHQVVREYLGQGEVLF